METPAMLGYERKMTSKIETQEEKENIAVGFADMRRMHNKIYNPEKVGTYYGTYGTYLW